MAFTRYTLPSILAAALLAKADSGFGNLAYLGPWSSTIPASPYLKNVTYSLEVPDVLSEYDTSDSSLWVSIWMGVQPDSTDVMESDLVQPLLNWCIDQTSCGCPASATEWCVAASTYTPEGQLGEAYVAVPRGSILDFAIYLDGDSIYQTVSMNGEVVSQMSNDIFYPGTFYGANECSSTSCGALPAYSWSNITMTFSDAVTDLDSYAYFTGASGSAMVSSEDGKVWTWSEIKIDANPVGEWSN